MQNIAFKCWIGLVGLLMVACSANSDLQEGPEVDASEGIVEALDGRAVGELWVDRNEAAVGEAVVVQVRNHGELALGFGRPVKVELWDGESWVETEASRTSAWTMDYLYAFPGERGPEQIWPFGRVELPEPGWYRFTKTVNVENPSGDNVQMQLRARVVVLEE